MYTAVIFDYGNVLCALDRENFINKAAARARAPNAHELLCTLWGGTSIEIEFETGRINSREYFAQIQQLVDLEPEYSYSEFMRDYQSIILPNPDGERALELVARRGLRSFVLQILLFACLGDLR